MVHYIIYNIHDFTGFIYLYVTSYVPYTCIIHKDVKPVKFIYCCQ